jgi:hypothetical protein
MEDGFLFFNLKKMHLCLTPHFLQSGVCGLHINDVGPVMTPFFNHNIEY